MVRKQIQKHNFLTGGPVLQREIYFGDDWVWTPNVTNDFDEISFNTDVSAYFGEEPMVTEERIREIFREEYYNVLRENPTQD